MKPLTAREQKAAAMIAVAVIAVLGFSWWDAERSREKDQDKLHRVCEALRKENQRLQDANSTEKIAPALETVFAAGCVD